MKSILPPIRVIDQSKAQSSVWYACMPMTQKSSDPTIIMPKFNEGGVFKPQPFLYVKSNPFKNGTKRFSFENRFH